MKIVANNISFKAKPTQYITADKVLRIMNTHYPTASSSRYIKFVKAQNNSRIKQAIGLSIGITCANMRKKILQAEISQNPVEFFNDFLSDIKKSKASNCFEQVKLFSFIMDLNNIETKIASLLPSSINHCVALIPLKEDAFEKTDFIKTPISKMKDFLIADPWLGIVDYAPNIVTLYKNHPDYNRFIGSPQDFENWEVFIPKLKLDDYYLYPQEYHSKKISIEDRKHFEQKYPELFIEKK